MSRSRTFQVPPMQRGEMKAFLTNGRQSSSVIAPLAVGITKTSLGDVWDKAMFPKAAELRDVHVEEVLKVDPRTNTVKVPRYVPERFERGRVQQPHVTIEETDATFLTDDGAFLMSHKERRRRHDTLINCKIGEVALKEAFAARTKLFKTCENNYPHGALGIVDSPFGIQNTCYHANAEAYKQQDRVALRRSKGAGLPLVATIQDVLRHDR